MARRQGVVWRWLRAVVRELGQIAVTAAFVETGTRAEFLVLGHEASAAAADCADRRPSVRRMSRVERDLWRQLADLTAPDPAVGTRPLTSGGTDVWPAPMSGGTDVWLARFVRPRSFRGRW